MTQDDAGCPGTVTGTVKWFDPTRGFGFVVAEGVDSDILLHSNVLRHYGLSSLVEGASVTLRVQHGDRGLQAIEVVACERPAASAAPTIPDLLGIAPEQLAALRFEPARVKWFSRAKGFGFANVFGSADDVFIHAEVLRCSGLSDLLAGEAVAIKVINGRRGLMATEIGNWESVSQD